MWMLCLPHLFAHALVWCHRVFVKSLVTALNWGVCLVEELTDCHVDLAVDEFVLWTELEERARHQPDCRESHSSFPLENWLASWSDWQDFPVSCQEATLHDWKIYIRKCSSIKDRQLTAWKTGSYTLLMCVRVWFSACWVLLSWVFGHYTTSSSQRAIWLVYKTFRLRSSQHDSMPAHH